MTKLANFLTSIFAGFLLLAISTDAQSRTDTLFFESDARGPAELTVCSQNLESYGDYFTMRGRSPRLTTEDYRLKEQSLVRRFVKAGCDVIAVQEVLGKNEDQVKVALNELAKALRKATNRFFDIQTGPSNDPMLHLGFLIAKDRADVINKVSYARVQLPKFQKKEKPRFFTRGPLEIQLAVRPQADSQRKTVTLVTFHLKSKAGGAKDPTGLDYEMLRMQMAEGLRKVVENRHATSFGSAETLLLLLGDRNSNFDEASARIFEGSLELRAFRGDGACRLSKRGVPLCHAGSASPQRLFSVLVSDPQVKNLPGTHRYKNVYSWLDDILMPQEGLRFAQVQADQTGDFDSGVIYEPAEASDHALVWVRLNW